MKYRFFFLLIPSLALLAPQGLGQEKGYQTPYFPLRVGAKWHYRVGEGQKVVVKAAKLEEFKIMGDKGKEEKVQGMVLEITGSPGNLKENVAVLKDGVYRFSSGGTEITPPLCFLKFPPQKGGTWQVDAVSNDAAIKGTFTWGEADVTVPAGSFKTITSTSQDFQIGNKKMILEYYFAPNVGLVKQFVHVGNFKLLLELVKYEP